MKKLYFLIFLLIAAFALQAQDYRGYYDGITDQTGTELKAVLHNIIKTDNHTSYNGLWDAYYQTDKRNTNKVWDIYSDNPNGALPYEYTLGDSQCGNYNGEGSCYNREHLWAQSWAKGTKHETDLHHVYPTDGYVNARRGNYAFGEVTNATWTSLNGGKLGTCTTTGFSGTVFEPIDEYKGDIARALMYVSVRYYTEDSNWGSSDMTSGADILPWAVTMLLHWHAEDPVSAKEIARNDAVYGIQGNRNPFVDHPEYAARIWTPNTTYNITASVSPSNSGTVNGAGSYSAGQSCTLTATPNSGYTFLNWTKNDVVVSTDASYTFTVAENATYKANFSTTTNYQIAVTASAGGSAYIGTSPTPTSVTKSIDLSAQGYSNEQNMNAAIISIDGNVSVTFNKGTGSTNPTYYTNGTAVRCYGGNNFVVNAGSYTITSITLTFGTGGDSNAITTNVNTFSSPTWTGSASSVTFTIGGTSGNRRIKGISVTYSGGSPATQANFAVGSTATVTAAPNSQYVFVDWTKNDVHVSSDIYYTFTVTEAESLRANFMHYKVNENRTVASLTLNGTVTVWSGYTLTVTGTITQPEGSSIVLNNTGQLINNTPGITGKVKKNITEWNEGSKTGWQAISTPVNNVAFTNVDNLTNVTYNVYRLNETNLMWENSQDNNMFNTFENGRGYLYRKNNNTAIVFNGTFNVGTVIYPLTYTSSATKGFHLIGNPYPHNIYKGDGAAIPNTYLEEGFYTLTSSGAWQAGTDRTTPIAPCQAILVQAKNTIVEGDELTITNTTATGAKRDFEDNIMFTVSNSNYEDVAYAVFKEGHGLNKIEHRNEDIQMLYIEHNGENFAIANIEENARAFNLKFRAATTGKYTMKIKPAGDFSYLHLVDNLTGEDVDLLIEDEYSFIGSFLDKENRFIVKLRYNSVNYDDDVFVYQNGNDLIIDGEGDLQIFDVMGRVIATQRINGVEAMNTSSLSTGLYIFRLIGTEMKTQKIVVK